LSEGAGKARKDVKSTPSLLFAVKARVVVGEGKTEVSIRIEQIFNELVKRNEIDIVWVYPLSPSLEDDNAFNSICAEHTAVCCQ
jgi:hypothetical protein